VEPLVTATAVTGALIGSTDIARLMAPPDSNRLREGSSHPKRQQRLKEAVNVTLCLEIVRSM
jgi:hypothetical protein